MSHQVQFRDYRGIMGKTMRKLPDGRRLFTQLDQPATIVDLEGHEIFVSSSELVALIAVSEMSFPKTFRSKDWTENALTASAGARR
jgi:hypothetical protein